MSEPRVTITLGRSGQVVKRGDNVRQNNRVVNGRKRYLEDRSRASFVDDYMPRSKRQRGHSVQRSSVLDRLEGYSIDQNDLRLKLMHKRSSKRIEHVPRERRNRDPHEAVLPLENSGLMHRKAELNRNGQSRWIPSGQIAELHPPRRSSGGIQQNVLAVRSVSAARAVPRASPLSSGGLLTMKSTPGSAQPIGLMKASRSMMPGNTSMGEEPLNVGGFLKSLGLEKYAITLQAEEVDMATLRQMGDKDLKELGIPMGPRKKILLALMPKAKRQLPQLNIK